MPSVEEYEAGYGLKQGMELAGYRLTKMNIQHQQVVRWNEYKYPTSLEFTWAGAGAASEASMNQLLQDFTTHIDGLRVIYTEKGTPYKCLFQYPPGSTPGARYSKDYKTVALTYSGYGKRVGHKEAEAIKNGTQTSW